MFSKLKSQYHQAIEVLIRPPRHEYSLSDLGIIQIKMLFTIKELLSFKRTLNNKKYQKLSILFPS